MSQPKQKIIEYFNSCAQQRDYWCRRSWYYHRELERFMQFIIPEDSSVLEIGCGTGNLLAGVKPGRSLGIDVSDEMIKIARNKYPHYKFVVDDIENLKTTEKFSYIIMTDLIGNLYDVWVAFRELQKVTHQETRIIITSYNLLWEPVILLAEKLHLKMRQYYQNWLSIDDITNLLFLNDYEVVRKGYRFLFPIYIPLISGFINKYIARLPFIKKLCLVWFVVAKQKDMPSVKKDYTCSIVVPCKNEFGNIEDLITRTPNMGRGTEIIFVDGNSSDGTVDKIIEMIQKYPDKKIKLLHQGTGTGKADAVRKGFEAAVNEILIILDADLTVPPEDLVKFYLVLAENKAEFVNGTRLVYPLEKESMRVLNILGNKIFSLIFTWILEQRVKDTLCGTKALFKEDYELIKRERKYFGDFDPFGDFDLIFGAAKLNLKMVEVPVRYKKRKYGSTKISRLRHGLSLLRMSFLAFKKF